MDHADHESRAEQVLEWGAALALGAAGGFAGFAIVPASPFAGAPVAAATAAALAMTLVGLAAMRRAGAAEAAGFDFALVPLDEFAGEEPLELVDRIEAPATDSRVVRLFAPETIAAPGDLAARIDDWLDGARQRIGESGERLAAVAAGHGPRSSPASAALYAALADIRRSLR